VRSARPGRLTTLSRRIMGELRLVFWSRSNIGARGKKHSGKCSKEGNRVSAHKLGGDKDSEHRQRRAIEAFAKRDGYEIVAEFYDAAVSGADHIDTRPGFAAMLERIEGNGVRIIIVETANRFARERAMPVELPSRKDVGLSAAISSIPRSRSLEDGTAAGSTLRPDDY
jgi:Resolvase, N terminal domain